MFEWTIPFFSKSYWNIPLGVGAAQAICPCMESQSLRLSVFPVTTAWSSPHDCCKLIHLHHIQPNQLSHQLSIFIHTGNNSYFHLQCSPAKLNFPHIFKHQGHFVDSSWRKNSKETFFFTQKGSSCLCSSHLISNISNLWFLFWYELLVSCCKLPLALHPTRQQ